MTFILSTDQPVRPTLVSPNPIPNLIPPILLRADTVRACPDRILILPSQRLAFDSEETTANIVEG
jgi:hypothetical protein